MRFLEAPPMPFDNNESVHSRGNLAQFSIPSAQVKQTKPPALGTKFLCEFLFDGRTPARAMSDAAMQLMLPSLGGPGPIIELGAASDYYKNFVPPGQRYLTSDLSSNCDLRLDMTKLDLKDDSVDALVSVFALEHLFSFHDVFEECKRVLKPRGRLLLVVPFLYYYHAAPDDFFRFTSSALDRLLSPLEILVRQPLGSRGLLFSELLHEKVNMGSVKSTIGRLALRCVALPFLASGLSSHDARYAFAFAYLCEKGRSA